MSSVTVSSRAQYLMRILVERYIRDGQPVGSKTLSQDASLGVSPATIRNWLVELETQGYLLSPHTSAGRIPTNRGYRLFINQLVSRQDFQDPDPARLAEQLSHRHKPSDLVGQTSQLLAELTQMTGLVTVPRLNQTPLKQLEFLPLSENRILVVLVLSGDEIQNRILESPHPFSREELRWASNFINQNFAGHSLIRVQQQILQMLQDTRQQLDSLMSQALQVASQALQVAESECWDCVVSGQSHLLDMAPESSIKNLRQLFDAFSQKQELLHLLDRCLQSDGVQIFIGEESGQPEFQSCSLITAPYRRQDQRLGMLAVIGPTRMNYQKVIPLVDLTARLLSDALNHTH